MVWSKREPERGAPLSSPPTGAEQRTTQTNKEEEVTPYMFKMLNPRRFYHAVGRKKFLEFLLLAAFILFFYGPMLNMLMLAFANEYTI